MTGASIGGAFPSRSMRIGCSPAAARSQHVRQVRVADVHRLVRAHVGATQRVQEDVAVRLRRSDDRRRHHEVHQPRDLVRVQDRQQVAAPVGDDALHQPARPPRLERRDRLRERLPLRRVGVPVVQRLARRADLLDRQIARDVAQRERRSTPSRTSAPPGPTRTSRARPRPAASRRTPPRPETRPRCSSLDGDAELMREEVPDLVDLRPRLHQRVPGVVEDGANHRSG